MISRPQRGAHHTPHRRGWPIAHLRRFRGTGKRKIPAMKRGKDVRNAIAKPIDGKPPEEIPVLSFVMVQKASGTFILRFVTNEDVIGDLQRQSALDTFLTDVDQLYAEFKRRFEQ